MSTVVFNAVCVQGPSCPRIDCAGKSVEIQGLRFVFSLIASVRSVELGRQDRA